MAVRENPRQTPADLARWEKARTQAIDALRACPVGRVFLVGAEQPGGIDFDVIVGVAKNELRPH